MVNFKPTQGHLSFLGRKWLHTAITMALASIPGFGQEAAAVLKRKERDSLLLPFFKSSFRLTEICILKRLPTSSKHPDVDAFTEQQVRTTYIQTSPGF
jgi:hypothetical protein